MIDYLKGVVAEATPTYAVIECCGVGYEVNITLMDYPLISGNQECKLYVHESIPVSYTHLTLPTNSLV